jgi:hypothetical protein
MYLRVAIRYEYAHCSQDQTSSTGALNDEAIDLGLVKMSCINPDLLEEPLDLQADDPWTRVR